MRIIKFILDLFFPSCREGDWERLTRQMNARKEFDRANLYKKLSMK